MIDRVTKITTAAEEITDELTHSAGMIITKITPLLAPLASGFCTLFAFYDGGAKLLQGKVKNPEGIALAIGLVLMLVVEGINFASTFNRDRAEKIKAQHPIGFINLDTLVAQCFWLTVGAILMLETLPGAVGWYTGAMSATDMMFRAGLLILPFFGKAGAKIFSVSMLLDSLEGVQEQRRAKRLQAQKETAELAIDLETKRQEASIKLAQLKAEGKQRMDLERLRVEARLAKSAEKQQLASVEKSAENSTPTSGESVELNGKKAKIQQRRNMIFQHIKTNGDPGASALGEQFGVDRGTIYGDLKALASEDKIYKNGDGGYHVKH
jgi:hypothetical protein